MDTPEASVENKKATTQLSLRIPAEIKDKLLKAAESKGMTLSEFIIPILSGETQSTSKDLSVVSVKELSDKSDLIIELLKGQVPAQPSRPGETTDPATEKLIDDSMEEARREHEEHLRSQYFMIPLNERQKNLVLDLLSYREKKGKPFSRNIESLFYFMLRETFSGPSARPSNFDQEFKEAFTDQFENAPKPEVQVAPAVALLTLPIVNDKQLQKIMSQRKLSELDAISYCLKYTLDNTFENFPAVETLPAVTVQIENKDQLARVMEKRMISELEAIDYCIDYTFRNDWL